MKKTISDFPVRNDYPGLQEWRCSIWNFSIDCFSQLKDLAKVLEVGPSLEDFSASKMLENRSDCQIETIGIDISKKDFFTYFGSAENMKQVKSDSYDLVVCTEVLEHVKKPWLAADEMYRVAKNNGYILLTVPCNIKFHGCPDDFWRFINVESLCLLFSKNENLKIINHTICGDKDFPIGIGVLLQKNENSN